MLSSGFYTKILRHLNLSCLRLPFPVHSVFPFHNFIKTILHLESAAVVLTRIIVFCTYRCLANFLVFLALHLQEDNVSLAPDYFLE